MTAYRMIDRESTSLAHAFEMNNKKLHCLIQPQQQFCATFDNEIDSRNHLDISNKVSAV